MWEWGVSALSETRLRSRACTGNELGHLTEYGEDLAKLEVEPEPNKTEEIEGSKCTQFSAGLFCCFLPLN